MYQLEREIKEIAPELSNEQLINLFKLFRQHEREVQQHTIRDISEALGRSVAEIAAFVMERWALPLPVPVARIFASATAKATGAHPAENV